MYLFNLYATSHPPMEVPKTAYKVITTKPQYKFIKQSLEQQ